jgi:glycerophosphoryl diester phosphodiesterase
MSEPSFSQGAQRLVVAHRGDPAHESENTLPSFESAIVAGADAIELDVRISADGVAVVMHDPGVERTTDGQGLVRDLSLAAIKGLGIRTADGGTTQVPTLEETLAALSGRVAVDVEIKNVPGEPDFEADRERGVEATLRALDRIGFRGPVLISSFNPFSIARSRELAPDLPTGLLTAPDVDARAALGFANEQGHPWVLPYAGAVLRAEDGFGEEALAAGMLVGAWIADDPALADALWDAGVTAVATNDPAAIVSARDRAR